jgi:hypothetical protein
VTVGMWAQGSGIGGRMNSHIEDPTSGDPRRDAIDPGNGRDRALAQQHRPWVTWRGARPQALAPRCTRP